jgi:hypothetical protein
VREVRGGKLNVSDFGTRMRGEGTYADQIGQCFTSSASAWATGARANSALPIFADPAEGS